MEGEVGARDGCGVAGGDGRIDAVRERTERIERALVAITCERACGAAFEGGPEPVDVAHVVGRHAHDERAAARFLFEEPFRAEQLERLAHRAAADRQLLGDLRLDQVLALAEPAGKDLLTDPICGVLGERARRAQRLEGRTVFHLARSIARCRQSTDDRWTLAAQPSPRARFIALLTSSMSKVIAKNPIS